MIIAFLGIVVHELSHLIFCWIFRAKVEKAKIFSPQGGYVSCSKPKIPLGRFFIGFAPVIVGTTVLYFLFNIFDLKISFNQFSDWRFWVFLIVATSILSYIAPSKSDIKASFLGLIVVIGIIIVLSHFGINISDSLYQKINQLFLVMIKIELLSVVVGLVLLLFKKLSHI